MAPICRAIEHKVRWSHHVVLSETRGGSVQLQLECRTPILKEWTISNTLLWIQKGLVPRLDGMLDTLDILLLICLVSNRVIECPWMYIAEVD